MYDREVSEQLGDVATRIKDELVRKPEGTIDVWNEGLGIINYDQEIREQSFDLLKPAVTKSTGKVGAVDGSSIILLDAGPFLVGAFRSGFVVFDQGKLVKKQISPTRVILISHANRKDIYQEALSKVTVDPLRDVPHELPVMLQHLRVLEEWRHANELLSHLEEGDMLMMDGSLWATINWLETFLDSLTAQTSERGVHLIGVSKRSKLSTKTLPLVPLVARKGNTLFPKSPWTYSLDYSLPKLFGKTYIVKYHPSSRFAFRTDVNLKERREPNEVFGKVMPYCCDPMYLGYPYPLAHAHTSVVLDHSMAEDLRFELESTAVTSGIPMRDWEMLFSNFHDILDLGL